MIKESSRKGRVLNTTFLALLFILHFFSACVWQDNKLVVTGLKSAVSGPSVQVSAVQINASYDKIIINGSNLDKVTQVQIQTKEGWTLSFDSQSSSQIVASILNLSASALNLALETSYNLLISTAYATTPVIVTFTLPNNSVTTNHIVNGTIAAVDLATMGAVSGQFLQFNGINWSPASIATGLTYKGTWNASTDAPNLSVTNDCGGAIVSGEYYIVDTNGATNVDGVFSWTKGDWIVCSSSGSYQKIVGAAPVLALDDITNVSASTPVVGDLLQYSGANWTNAQLAINQLSDVDTVSSPPTLNQVLKWDGANWTPQADALGSGAVASVNTQSGIVTLDTDDITEGVSNYYFTQARARTAVSASNGISYVSGTGVFSANFGTTATTVAAGNHSHTDATLVTSGFMSATDKTKLDNLATDAIQDADFTANGFMKRSAAGVYTTVSTVAPADITACANGEILKVVAGVFSCGTDLSSSSAQVESYIADDVTTGYIPYDDGTKLTTSGLFWDNTNSRLGIGTTTPTHALTIQQNAGGAFINLQNTTSSTGAAGQTGITFRRTTTGAGASANTEMAAISEQVTVLNHATRTADLVFENINNGSFAASPNMIIKGSGNVGIGTNAPARKLHLFQDSTDSSRIRLERDSNANASGVGTIEFYGKDSAANIQQYGYITGGIKTNTNGAEDGQFNIATMVGGTITDVLNIVGGNVGIGTTAPARLLTVNGAAADSRVLLQTTNSGSTIADGLDLKIDTSNNAYIWQYENARLGFATNNSERMTIDTAGNVGIGTTAPNRQLTLYSATTDPYLSFTRASNSTGSGLGRLNWNGLNSASSALDYGFLQIEMSNSTAGSEEGAWRFHSMVAGVVLNPMSIVGSRVGIGTNTPSTNLHVVGSARITGVVNGCIQADATGVLSSTGSACGTGSGSVTAVSASAPLVVTGTTTPSINIPASTTSVDGYLTSTDWTTFNNKLTSVLNSGYMFVGNGSNVATAVLMSGDTTVSASGVVTISNNAVTTNKIVNGAVTNTKLAGLSAANCFIGETPRADGAGSFYCGSTGDDTTGAIGQWTLNSGNVYRSSGNVGIGATPTVGKLHITNSNSVGLYMNGNTSAQSASDLYIARTSSASTVTNGPNIRFDDGTSNNANIIQNSQGSLAFWNYGAGAWNERMRISTTGNVGIGTTTPNTPLTVVGPSLALTEYRGNIQGLDSTAMAAGVGGGIIFGGQYTSAGALAEWGGISAIKVNSTTNDAGANLIFTTRPTGAAGGTSSTERMRISSAGNVGIGTSSPSLTLDVLKASAANDTYSNIAVVSGGADATLGPLKLLFGVYPSAAGSNRYAALYAGDNVAQRPLILNWNGSASGNVGIGTTTPSAKLHVNNTTAFDGAETATGQDSVMLFGGDSAASGTYNGGISWLSGGRRRAGISSVKENADGDHLGLAFFTQGVDGPGNMFESMRISRAGYVGIGTTAPGTTLHVKGSTLIERDESDAFLGMRSTLATPAAGRISDISSQAKNNSAAYKDFTSIKSYVTDVTAASEDGDISFDTITNGTLSEKMRITSGGNMGIGTTIPAEKLDLGGGNIKMGYETITVFHAGGTWTAGWKYATCTAGKYVTGGSCTSSSGSAPTNTDVSGTAFGCYLPTGYEAQGYSIKAICMNVR